MTKANGASSTDCAGVLADARAALRELQLRALDLATAGRTVSRLANVVVADACADPGELLQEAGWIGEQISRCATDLTDIGDRADSGHDWRSVAGLDEADVGAAEEESASAQ
jgi:hypothetical protein